MEEDFFCLLEDRFWMEQALLEAEKAFSQEEVPVGAVLVSGGRLLSSAYNMTEQLCDASAHAETLCIRKASNLLSNWRLTGTTLYTTLEPCIMCFGTLVLSRVGRVVFAAPDLRHGALCTVYPLSERRHPIHNFTFLGGVLEKKSSDLLKQFFRKRREVKKWKSVN